MNKINTNTNTVINARELTKALVILPGETVNLETLSVFDQPGQKGQVLIKAVVAEGGSLNLKGMIKIGKKANGVEAFLRQSVLLLGASAKASAVPELEIESNEVKASHAASVGQIDKEQMFYLQSRGLSEKDAKKLIIASFFEEIFSKIDLREVELIKSKLAKI